MSRPQSVSIRDQTPCDARRMLSAAVWPLPVVLALTAGFACSRSDASDAPRGEAPAGDLSGAPELPHAPEPSSAPPTPAEPPPTSTTPPVPSAPPSAPRLPRRARAARDAATCSRGSSTGSPACYLPECLRPSQRISSLSLADRHPVFSPTPIVIDGEVLFIEHSIDRGELSVTRAAGDARQPVRTVRLPLQSGTPFSSYQFDVAVEQAHRRRRSHLGQGGVPHPRRQEDLGGAARRALAAR